LAFAFLMGTTMKFSGVVDTAYMVTTRFITHDTTCISVCEIRKCSLHVVHV
jgi:hypothetical protein